MDLLEDMEDGYGCMKKVTTGDDLSVTDDTSSAPGKITPVS